jgi:nitrite reductase/ring-hydroxylating ferredoxin subunit
MSRNDALPCLAEYDRVDLAPSAEREVAPGGALVSRAPRRRRQRDGGQLDRFGEARGDNMSSEGSGKPPVQIPNSAPEPTAAVAAPSEPPALENGEFRMSELPPGAALLVGEVAVFNVGGNVCATQAKCTHKGGPLNEGTLDGSTVTCPWHGSQFDVCTGAVLRGPAREPVKSYRVTLEGDIGQVDAG